MNLIDVISILSLQKLCGFFFLIQRMLQMLLLAHSHDISRSLMKYSFDASRHDKINSHLWYILILSWLSSLRQIPEATQN